MASSLLPKTFCFSFAARTAEPLAKLIKLEPEMVPHVALPSRGEQDPRDPKRLRAIGNIFLEGPRDVQRVFCSLLAAEQQGFAAARCIMPNPPSLVGYSPIAYSKESLKTINLVGSFGNLAYVS